MTFISNSADTVGGAMLVNNFLIDEDFETLYNSDCFFQSSIDKLLTPDQWVCTSTLYVFL